MKSKSTNHHYVSQVEQRLSSIDPSRNKKKQRIYSYSIIDREVYKIELDNKMGVKIENNLSYDDLYSFDEFESKEKYSLEGLFGEYERDIGALSTMLISNNNSNTKEEIIRIFILKVLNTFRNPFCIEKTLNTLVNLSTHFPTDEKLQSIYEKIEKGTDPTREKIASEFGITEMDYVQWIKSLFLMLALKNSDGENFLESMLHSLFENSGNIVNVYLNVYTGNHKDKYVAISDRGFTVLTDREEYTTYEFNLSANSFITYVFTDIRKSASSMLSGNIELAERIIKTNSIGIKNVSVHRIENNLDILARYNENVIYQSHSKVFCKGAIYGL